MNRLRVTPLGGAIALLLGIGALLLGTALAGPEVGVLTSAAWLAGSYFTAALALGIVWPRPSWAWGIWLSLPFAGLLLVSLGFAGEFNAFIRHDAAPLLGAVAGGMSGGTVGKLVKGRFLRPEPANGP